MKLFNFNTKMKRGKIIHDHERVIKLLETGDYTLQALGSEYNVTRERVRQIWYEHKGFGFKGYRKQKGGEKK